MDERFPLATIPLRLLSAALALRRLIPKEVKIPILSSSVNKAT